MNILHVGPFKIGTVNGSYNAVWNLARAQSRAGNSVSILRFGKDVVEEQVQLARDEGVTLLGLPVAHLLDKGARYRFREILSTIDPDVCHFSYVRIPGYLWAMPLVQRAGVCFVISTHGGMNSMEMERKRLRKIIYWHLAEKRLHKRAGGIHFVSEGEARDYRSRHRPAHLCDKVIPNVVEIPQDLKWRPRNVRGSLDVGYFGRYDVWHKGLDKAVTWANHCHQLGVPIRLHLHGEARTDKDVERLHRLQQEQVDVEVLDHGFLSSLEMFQRMIEMDFVIQYSRFEAFGISAVEALGIGVPLLISEASALSDSLARDEAAFVLRDNPEDAAREFVQYVADQDTLRRVAENGRLWAASSCSPNRVAQAMSALYKCADP